MKYFLAISNDFNESMSLEFNDEGMPSYEVLPEDTHMIIREFRARTLKLHPVLPIEVPKTTEIVYTTDRTELD